MCNVSMLAFTAETIGGTSYFWRHKTFFLANRLIEAWTPGHFKIDSSRYQ